MKYSLVAGVLGVGDVFPGWVLSLSHGHADLWIARKPAYLVGDCAAVTRFESVGKHSLSPT